MASSSSPSLEPQVFINFRGDDVRNDFVDCLVHAMEKENLNVFIDEKAVRGTSIMDLLVEIEQSTVAIAIFSKNYTNSYWCLTELVRINDCMVKGTLMAIPVFYRIKPSVIKNFTGNFGLALKTLKNEYKNDPVTEKWEEAIASITGTIGMELQEHSQMVDRLFIDKMIVEVKRLLDHIKKKGERIKELNTVQNVPYEAIQNKQHVAVQIRQSDAVQNKQPETVLDKPVVTLQGCTFYVRQLHITDSFNARYWTFVSISEPPNEAAIEVAKMTNCYYLEVRGKFHTSELTYGRRYEVVFVVKVEDTMFKWDNPAKVQLMVPDKDLQERELQFVDLVRNEWIEIQAGVFDARPHKAQSAFYLYQHDSKKKKSGLVVKCVIIRPVE